MEASLVEASSNNLFSDNIPAEASLVKARMMSEKRLLLEGDPCKTLKELAEAAG